jgi:hypothetical protein
LEVEGTVSNKDFLGNIRVRDFRYMERACRGMKVIVNGWKVVQMMIGDV